VGAAEVVKAEAPVKVRPTQAEAMKYMDQLLLPIFILMILVAIAGGQPSSVLEPVIHMVGQLLTSLLGLVMNLLTSALGWAMTVLPSMLNGAVQSAQKGSNRNRNR